MLQLETSRLILRDWQPADLPLIRELAGDARVTRYQTKLRLADDAACERWLDEAITHNAVDPRVAFSLAIVEAASGRAIGWLNWEDAGDPRGDISFGYALLPEVWNRGYITEAVQSMLAHVFATQQRASVYATCASSNPGSARVLEKSGLRLAHRWMHHDDYLVITEEYRCYALTRDEWLSAQ